MAKPQHDREHKKRARAELAGQAQAKRAAARKAAKDRAAAAADAAVDAALEATATVQTRERRPGGDMGSKMTADAILLRTIADADARAMFEVAPELGSTSLRKLNQRLWSAIVDLPRATKVCVQKLTVQANRFEKAKEHEAAAELRVQIVRLQLHTAGAMKDLGKLIADVSKIHVQADLDKAFAEMRIITDAWRDGMKTTNPPPPPPLDEDEDGASPTRH